MPVSTVSVAELAEHATPDRCWVVLHGVVYDATPLVADHPGGAALAEACGTDVTRAFEDRPGGLGPHPARARAALGPHVVGVLDGTATPARPSRARARSYGTLTAAHVAAARTVEVEAGHAIDGDGANVWIGAAYGVGGRLDLAFGHATRTGESDLAARGYVGGARWAGALTVGTGFRFQGVPEADGPGVYAELSLAARPAPWVELALVPGVAALPTSPDPVCAEVGGALLVRPAPVVSLYAEVRHDLSARGSTEWAGGVRLHTTAHTFSIGAGSAASLAPLERLAAPEPGFAVHLALTRRFGG